jgi:hypothetical protein
LQVRLLFVPQERLIAEGAALQDCEEETLRSLAEIRQAIVGEIRNAEGLEAVRAALRKLFEAFILHRGDSDAAPARQYADLAFLGMRGEYVIEPVVRDVVIEGYTEKLTPIIRREPLYTAENKHVMGLPIQYLFRPIPCGIGPREGS